MARGRRDHDRKKPNDQSTSRGSARRLRAASSLSAVVSWPGKQYDSPLAASLLAQASEIMASAGATGTARHAFADQADVLLQQALGFNTSTTSTTWAHLMELPFNASSTHSCDDLSARRRELRASLTALGIDAAQARVGDDAPDLTALSRGLGRCLHGGAALSVVTMGCSMSEGQSAWLQPEPTTATLAV